jgi:hypothetical protein
MSLEYMELQLAHLTDIENGVDPIIKSIQQRLEMSPTVSTLRSEYGLYPWMQMSRFRKVAQTATLNYSNPEKIGFWKGLEWGYTARERFSSNVGIECSEIVEKDQGFKDSNKTMFTQSGKKGLANLVGYMIGAEMAGLRIATDVIAAFALENDASPADIIEIMDRHGNLEKSDQQLKSDSGMGISLVPARKSTITSVQTSFKGQVELARGKTVKFTKPEKAE